MATNCVINGKKYYKLKRVVGHRNGKPVYKYFYGTNKTNALNKYYEFIDYETPEYLPFDETADYYIRTVLSVNSKYAQGTIDKYILAYRNHIKGKIKTPIADIRPLDLQEFYNSLHVSYSTIQSVHKFMRGYFRWLEQNSYCHDHTRSLVIPVQRVQHDTIITWTDEEIDTIFANLDKCNLRFMVVLALYTGMRIGELQGLKFADFRDDYILIERQYQNGSFVPTKGKESRVVPMHDVVRRELEIYPRTSGSVFTTDTGNIMDARNIRRSLKRFYARIGVEHKKFHAFRATFCTNLCKNGVPIQVASKLMGHKSVDVTAKYYASVSLDEKKIAIDHLPDYGGK